MPILIGEKLGSDLRNPLGLLSDCRRRIENFLDVLHRVAQNKAGQELDDEHRRALQVSLDYFRDSAPEHTLKRSHSFRACSITAAANSIFSMNSRVIIVR